MRLSADAVVLARIFKIAIPHDPRAIVLHEPSPPAGSELVGILIAVDASGIDCEVMLSDENFEDGAATRPGDPI